MTARRIVIIVILVVLAFAAIWVVDRRVMQRAVQADASQPAAAGGGRQEQADRE